MVERANVSTAMVMKILPRIPNSFLKDKVVKVTPFTSKVKKLPTAAACLEGTFRYNGPTNEVNVRCQIYCGSLCRWTVCGKIYGNDRVEVRDCPFDLSMC